jgi:serine/threonine protein kinase/formylglycine-generating enzyme required for sulfatase activity
MQKKIRPDPLIPDHEVLRKIGGGAYGEVWLARGVTGAMRAVKFVYREDFSDERTFEREFEGILRFEPISRDHRGFVNILHVGRSDDQSEFYYYVMELGDDAHDEGEINPVEYEPRTLRTDMLRANGKPLPTYFCIETGRRLAEALSELHERGLTHRDVKPSNVIFVDGKAKLADIGLVAAKDQRTFVGTEGFVPPEGPGSEQADIYSLGKVLYEMATGMDRLQFPELPNEGPGNDYRKKWIRLNRLICDICDPRIAKRKIKTGKELAETLGHLQRGRNAPKKIPAFVKVALLLLMFVGAFASQIWVEKTWGTHIIEGKREPLPPRYVMVKVLTDPDGAEVYNSKGELISDTTPATLYGVEIDSELKLILKAPKYRDLPVNRLVADTGGNQVMIIEETLSLFSPPKVDEIWTDALDHQYLPFLDQHKSADHVSEADWKLYLKETERKLKPIPVRHGDGRIVAVPEEWTADYATWLEGKCLEEGYFEEYSEDRPESNRQLVASYDFKFDQAKLPAEAKKGGKILRPFYCLVRPIPYGSLSIVSKPSGAEIYLNGIPMGYTPLEEDNIAPGDIKVTLVLGGRKTLNDTIYLPDRGQKTRDYDLEPDESLVPGKSWTNSIEMELEPLGDTLSVSKWETRSVDYRRFLKETKQRPGQVILSNDPLVPVVGVTRADCEAFCEWLTKRERDNGNADLNIITEEYRYRLPTDQEWSRMAGLIEVGESPAERENDVSNVSQFPWGESFPPPNGAGNYADSAAVEIIESDRLIAGYLDGFPKLAPVGKFKPNIMGLFDLGGNVHEWVSDSYLNEQSEDMWGVLRGGGWNSFSEGNLESRFRLPVRDLESRKDIFGFRVVLARKVEEEEPETNETEESDGGDSN